jgi:hypothetical protein
MELHFVALRFSWRETLRCLCGIKYLLGCVILHESIFAIMAKMVNGLGVRFEQPFEGPPTESVGFCVATYVRGRSGMKDHRLSRGDSVSQPYNEVGWV